MPPNLVEGSVVATVTVMATLPIFEDLVKVQSDPVPLAESALLSSASVSAEMAAGGVGVLMVAILILSRQ